MSKLMIRGLVAVATIVGALAGGRIVGAEDPKPAKPVVAEMNAHALAAIVRAKVPVVLLDARGGAVTELIPGAKTCDASAPPTEIARLVASKDALVITYCGGADCPASQHLADRISTAGYLNVVRFTGGVDAWSKAGFDLAKRPAAAPAPAPRGGSGSR